MAVWGAVVRRILKQETRNSRRARFLLQLSRHKHHYSIYAGWLGGVGRRVSLTGVPKNLSFSLDSYIKGMGKETPCNSYVFNKAMLSYQG
jgi:hypothetical protein